MAEEHVGTIDHYFARIGVAGVVLTSPLKIGDRIRIRGHSTDFEQSVESMQIEHESVEIAEAGASVGITVRDRCREGDEVFKSS